jgi:PiT family inorganic phosphate transporter
VITVLLLFLVAGVAYANGANDVSKGVGTLAGSGLTTYPRAIGWGTLWTVAGALAAIIVSAGLVKTFSTGLLQNTPAEPDRFLLAVSAGVFAWVIFASWAGLPVSTTHALTGAILGTALVMDGPASIRWPLLGMMVVAPLALSPLVAGMIAYVLHAVSAARLSMASRYCVCLEQQPVGMVSVAPTGNTSASELSLSSRIVVGESGECSGNGIVSRVRITDAMHWATSAALSFARGMNDNPKIVAIGISAAGAAGIGSAGVFLAGAAAMGAGSYLYGRRVTKTLAEKVTKIDRVEGLSASFVAAALVLLASFMALPVSTTQVATGAIIGAGLRDGAREIQWNTVSVVVLAWLLTLPVAALIAAIAWAALDLVN